MTTDQLQQTAAAMTAYAAGKPVQFQIIGTNDWTDCPRPEWNCMAYLYRPKSEAKTRPWNKMDDVPLNCWVRTIRTACGPEVHELVTTVTEMGITVGINAKNLDWHHLYILEYSTDRKNWQPCTVTEP